METEQQKSLDTIKAKNTTPTPNELDLSRSLTFPLKDSTDAVMVFDNNPLR